ncbi:MAG: chalcone isomerase family protein [Myxococcota bacterium]
MTRALLVVAAVLAVATPALARVLEGVSMPDQVERQGTELILNGMGLRKRLVFDVYVAGLYVETPSKNPQELIRSDQTKHIQLFMLRDLDAQQVARAIREGFEKNSAAQMDQLEGRLRQLSGALEDVKRGEVLSLTYVPGEGTTLASKGEKLTVIEGEDFAHALFRVWLGENPVDRGLKRGLLGY